MSSWGNLDNVAAQGTVTSYAANSRVVGTSTSFLSNINAGDYVTITGAKFQVANVASNTLLFLTDNGIAASGVTAWIQQGPKFIGNVITPVGHENVYTIRRVFGADRIELGVANAAANASHTGWIHFFSYVDGQGSLRRKSEVLVAMSKNFAANATGHVHGTGAGVDASDNAVLPNAP